MLVYPVIFTKEDNNYLAYVPDLEIDTFGTDLANAIYMARDAISLYCVTLEDEGKPLPTPTNILNIKHKRDDILTLVDADIQAYRKMLDNRSIKKTLTIPSWLNEKAEKASINFSQTLQKALKEELSIVD